MGKYLEYDGLSLVIGNLKIGKDTVILNMGSAETCPSRLRGFCKLGNKCYARRAEHQYPRVLPYRNRQEHYWLNNSTANILHDFSLIAEKHKVVWSRIKYLRLNESGDFHSQKCITKLDYIAGYLKASWGITTYTYTAREDLDFSKTINFIVKGSSNAVGNNGKCIAKDKSIIRHRFLAARPSCNRQVRFENKTFTICPTDCSKCMLCKEKNDINIVFAIH